MAQLKACTTQTQALAVLSQRFTTNDARTLLNCASTFQTLTANINNTQTGWNSKVSYYIDTCRSKGWTDYNGGSGGGVVGPMVAATCEETRDKEITSCHHTEWFLTACSILGGFINPWVGIAASIETMIAAEACVDDAVSAYDKCVAARNGQ